MRTVLVADDDELLRSLIAEILSKAGYKVSAASDGLAAWELLSKRPADMAVLDLNMPRMDGLELIRKIRADARLKEMPVVLLTVRALVEDQVSGYDKGADDYLTKPFEPDMLLARLRVLERRILKG